MTNLDFFHDICHDLDGIGTLLILEVDGYIKKQKVMMLIDFGSTQNLINHILVKLLNFFIYLTPIF